jgi:arylsulfatase
VNRVLSEVFPTLAEHFGKAGYVTGAIVSNPWLNVRAGFSRGFELYAFFPDLELEESVGARALALLLPGTEGQTQLAMNWLWQHQDEDYFFWLHYLDPHVPYEPPRRFLPARAPPAGSDYSFDGTDAVRAGLQLSAAQKEWLRTLYLAEVQLVDEQIGRLLDYLTEQGIYEESLIILTSDHGEEFWEHGAYEHGHSVAGEVIAVPLMVKLPGSAHRGQVENPVSTSHLFSTILDLAGLRAADECQTGPSLRALWDSSAPALPAQYALSRSDLYGEPKEALCFGDHKLVRSGGSGSELVYDLQSDPNESEPIPPGSAFEAEGHRILEETLRTCAVQRQCYGASDEVPPQPMDEETERRLKSLGYIK